MLIRKRGLVALVLLFATSGGSPHKAANAWTDYCIEVSSRVTVCDQKFAESWWVRHGR